MMGFFMNEYVCGVCGEVFLVDAEYKGIVICNNCGSWSYDGGKTFIYANINLNHIKGAVNK